MTFLSGFLQDTPLNFVNYLFFSLLFIGGIVLIKGTVESEATRGIKGILLLTGISSILLFIFYIGYELLRIKGYDDLVGAIEALLYLTTLFFWIFVILSLILIWRIRSRKSS